MGIADEFAWGVATASYQIEGAVREDGRGWSVWDEFSRIPGKVWHGHTGDIACDHYHRWREDIALMQELGVDAYRLSIAWPRIVPDGAGPVNPAGLDFYDRLVDGLLDAGIQPWVTLFHWDLPQQLELRGGFRVRETAEAFARYSTICAERLGDRVTCWMTLNEPWVYSFLGHFMGLHAPGHESLSMAIDAAHGQLLGHGLAAQAIRATRSDASIGTVLNTSYARAANPDDPADVAAQRRYDGYHNRWFLDPLFGRGYPADMVELFSSQGAPPPVEDGDMDTIAQPLDVLGVNYYSTAYVVDDPEHVPSRARVISGDAGTAAAVPALEGQERTDAGWLVEPDGLHELLVHLKQEYPAVPIAITENGGIFDDVPGPDGRVRDAGRTRFLQRHIEAVDRAIADGVPMCGYFAWSLLDNFEWAQGYASRFGIVHVDYDTQRRTIKDSGHWFAQQIRERREARVPAAR